MQGAKVKPAVRQANPTPPPAPGPNARKPAQPQPPNTAPPTPAKKAGGTGVQTLVVHSKSQKDNVGLQALVGEYFECGKNHGRSFFKRKKAANGGDELTVFLYYWDMRDGADFSGWWFGDKVGGAQVWSRCEKSDQVPPKGGWRVPWDGAVQSDLVVEAKSAEPAEPAEPDAPTAAIPAKEEHPETKEELLDTSVSHAEVDERVQRATDRVVIAEIEATQALESVQAMMEGEVSEDSLKVVEELLQAQQSSMMDAHKVLAADIMDARKSSPKSVKAMNSLTPRVRSVQASLAQEAKQAKQLFEKKRQEAEEARQRAKAEQAQAKAEQRDAKALEEALPDAMEAVTSAEDTLDAVAAAAGPVSLELAEQMTESVSTALRETEAAVLKAQEAIKGARGRINQKITAAKQYAPEARKVALTEYSTLQEKLNEAQKKLAPFARIRKDFEQRLEGKKVMAEVASKLGHVEVEVEKVTSMLSGAGSSEDDVRSAEATLPPAAASLAGVMKLLDQKIAASQGALKEDLAQMRERGAEAESKVEAFRVQLRGRLEQLQLQQLLRQGLDRTQAAEATLGQTGEAEGAFLKGVELRGQEAAEAVLVSKEAAKAGEAAVNAAKSFLKAKLADLSRFPEESREATADELAQLQSRVEVVAQKLSAFRRETAARETSILLEEVTAKVVDAETKIRKTADTSAPLIAEKLEDMGVAKLKEATEQTLEAEKLAAIACADARKVLVAKQKDGQAKESPGYAAELAKLQGRVAAMQQELSKLRKVAVQGEKLWKSQLIVQEKEEQMKHVEAEVEKAELLTTPLGDERPSNESILEQDAAINAVQAALSEVVKSSETAQQTAQGALKAALVKLASRTKASQARIDEMKALTREGRERLQCETVLVEARARLQRVDTAFQQVAEAEVPYLKGIDVLPLEESLRAVADSEAAAAAVQQAVTDARSFLASKSLELRGLLEAAARPGLEELTLLARKNEEARERLAQFAKETEGRRRAAQQQEALAKISEAEEAVQRTILAAAPLATQSAEETPQDAAQEIVEKLGEAEQEAQDKLDAARRFLSERQKDKRAKIDAAELSQLVTRLNASQVDLAKAKAAASEHEQRFVAKMLLQETEAVVQKLESELEKASEAAAPLTLEGGKSFVVASMAKMVLDALSDHSQKNSISREVLFLQISPGAADGKVTEAELVAFLEKVPELCSRPDLAFSSEQRTAIFEHMDFDKDGMVGKADFLEMFRDRYICVQETSISDGFDIAQSKPVDTLQVDDVVEALGEQKSLDALGVMRIEVRVLKDGTTGWVTLQGNDGTMHFSPFTAYTAFAKNLDKTIGSAQNMAVKASSFIVSKSADLRECKQGPLADAKTELAKIKPKVQVMRAKVEQLHKKVEECKREHSKREEIERRKQEEKKDRKAASLVLATIAGRVEKAQAALKQLEETAAPLTSASEADLGSVAAPLTVRKAATEAAEALTALLAEAKESVTAHEPRVAKASKGPWSEAKQDMARLRQQVAGLEKRARTASEAARAAFDRLSEAILGQAAGAVRTALQARGAPIEALFAELAGAAGEQVPEAAFFAHLDGLPGARLSQEQKELILQRCAAGGLSRRSFFAMLERYFRCVKDIAITSDFDIKVSTTLRKLEAGEFIEVLEGPQTDDSLGVMRIKARALSDGKTGWITARGNQGTPFLEECSKPCYVAVAPVTIQDAFATDACNDVRALRASEVIEVVEGPRKEVLGNAVRARGKAVADGATGWFTVTSKQGQTCVQQGKSTYTCTSGIALTNDMNIKECKVLRKLDKGEVLVVVEGPIEDEAAGVTRIKARAAKDDMEGWVTTKGNAGSVYAKESGRTYVVSTRMPLQSSFESDSAADIRELAEDESIEVLEGPKEEQSNAAVRVLGRAVADGRTGWVTLRAETLRLWSPRYRCLEACALTGQLDTGKGELLRSLEPGEAVELLEGPREDAGSGALRLKGRAEKDGAIGWATAVGADGKPLLECVSAA